MSLFPSRSCLCLLLPLPLLIPPLYTTKRAPTIKNITYRYLGDEEKGFRFSHRFGKRGAKLAVKFKNPVPVDFAAAKAIYDGILAEKLKGGYTYGESGTPYEGTEGQGKVSGLRPMLLSEIDEEEALKLINDDDWVLQEKKNGVRQMVKKSKKTLEGVNKKGLVTSLPQTTADAIREACGEADAVIDGELVGEVLWMFDLLSMGIHAFADQPYDTRLGSIQEWLPETIGAQNACGSMINTYFKMVPTAVGKSSKKALFAALKKDNAEGVVFKRLDAPYKAGRSDAAKKFKFYATATVRVRCLNNKNSFQMEMLSKGDWKYVGDCTFYPTIYTPKPGDFVEVRYMYAFPQGSLYGPPVILEKREDCDEGDCVMSQLKYKQGLEVPNDDNLGEDS